MKKAKRHIYLVGFSGSGKSTVAPVLARRLGLGHADSDTLVEEKSGCSITSIFAGKGEAAFRLFELKTVDKLARSRDPLVIALGGGALLNRQNRTAITATGTVIYLRCSAGVIHKRLAEHGNRPLLHPSTGRPQHARIREMLALRRPGYEAAADLTIVTTNKSPKEVVDEILRRLGRL